MWWRVRLQNLSKASYGSPCFVTQQFLDRLFACRNKLSDMQIKAFPLQQDDSQTSGMLDKAGFEDGLICVNRLSDFWPISKRLAIQSQQNEF